MLDGTVGLQHLLRYNFFSNSSKILIPDLPHLGAVALLSYILQPTQITVPTTMNSFLKPLPSCLLIIPVLIVVCIFINHGYVYIR